MGHTAICEINSMDEIRKWKAVYRLLDQVNTEVFDCGTLCGSACCGCSSQDHEMGIYLFPGEHLLLQEICGIRQNCGIPEAVFGQPAGARAAKESALTGEGAVLTGREAASVWLEWETQDPRELGFPDSWTDPVYFVICRTAPNCPRKWRPLQCRTFPLKPVFGENGVLELIWNDEELPYACPIIENNLPVHDDFYKATYTVWTHLLRDPRIFDLVVSWSD